MKSKIKYIVPLLLASAGLAGCSGSTKDLDTKPQAVLEESQITTADNMEGFVIAAYATLGNDIYPDSHMPWGTGNVQAGDAHKGGNGSSDVGCIEQLQLHAPLDPSCTQGPEVIWDMKWFRSYEWIGRANVAIRKLTEVSATDFPLKDRRIAEMRFLRGWWYFRLKIHFKNIPFIDESVLPEDALTISNRALTDQQLWDRIAADFRYAAENLPDTDEDKGRANALNAKAFLAKTLLFQAYVQDENHNVTGIDSSKLEEVVSLVQEIQDSEQYALNDDYALNFLQIGDNSPESVFAIQRSQDDGTFDGKGSYGTVLSGMQSDLGGSGFYGCCGFHVPTENFVNAFRVDAGGLPLLDTFNGNPTAGDPDVAQLGDTVDPRLEHTVVREGQPFKYVGDPNDPGDPNIHAGDGWARAPGQYGNFVSQKELEHPNCGCLLKFGLPDFKPFTGSSMNTILIRYADVLLWKAEALIQLNGPGDLEEARAIINQIRTRAGSAASLSRLSGLYDYSVGTYDAPWVDQAAALKALQFERRIELGLEGHRFFDLVRWGIAAETINDYLDKEKIRKTYLNAGHFTKNKHEYLPIPQPQINLSGGLYEQNPGY